MMLPAGRSRTRPGVAGEHFASGQLIEIQRSRLLVAAARTVEELGYAGATVAHITRRARVSRRTFYELFANREECLLAVVEDILGQIRGELEAADLNGLAWRERVHAGLWVILSFLDREPALARMCVVQSLRGGPVVLARREEVLKALAGVIDKGRFESARGRECTPLTAEGLVGAASAIVYARLLNGDRRPLAGLLGELMGMIALPYLGPAAARREQVRPAPGSRLARPRKPVSHTRIGSDPLAGLPMRMTYRTVRVFEVIAEHPGANNRQIADYAEIVDQGQVSKLLARLERLGLLSNGSDGHSRGEPNAWTLTDRGEQVAHSIRVHAPAQREVAA
jgi:AcrR family transcriptional regulator/DNA-binding MarR family transcriptional regulator